ncbi:MAG: hypothetical protein GBAus27B_000560 [Mycoplasmataceae bacterium]|nr:MAG: hypothetical protein GBAus27B_000560 [Mycoplasmataceae bacterium]
MKFQEWLLKENIDKSTVQSLQIPNHLEFDNNELIIEGYPKLELLGAFSCALKKITLKEIPLLKTLNVAENDELAEIAGLENLANLEELSCFNCQLEKLDCLDKKNLREVFAASQFVSNFEINIQGCDSLENLDVAENNIFNLDCSNLLKLKDVSCKEVIGSDDVEKSDFFCKKLMIFLGQFINDEIKISEERFKDLKSNFITEFISSYRGKGKKALESFLKQWSFTIDSNILNDGKIHFSRQKIKEILLNKNFFSLNANFKNCTSLEYLNFSKSNLANLNVTNTPNLKGVIGGWMNEVRDLDEDGNKQYMLKAEPFGKDFIIGEVDSDPESDRMEDSEQEEVKYKSKTLTRAEYDQLLKDIEQNPALLKNYRTVTKTKLVKPPRDYEKEPWYNPAFWEDKNKFPHLVSLHLDNEKANFYDDPEYGERIYSYQQERAKENIQQGRHLYYGTTHLDFSHMKFTAMNINGDNYPDTITSINLGDNYLHSLKIANFPNLTRLIVSHNTNLTEETTHIDNCPKLDRDGLLPSYHYKSDDESRGTPADSRVYDEERDNPLKQKAQEEEKKEKVKQKLNDQVKELLAKDEKDATLKELLNLISPTFFKDLAEDLQNPFLNFFTKKLEVHVGDLIKQTKAGTLTKDQLFTEIEPLKSFLHLLSEETRNQLITLLERFTQKEESASSNTNILPLALIFGLAFLRIGFELFKKKKNNKYSRTANT